MKRAFVVVIDACGVGALPDAENYGDAGCNTLAHLAEAIGGLRLPVLERLGLGRILPLAGVARAERPVVHGRLHALGSGKDSTAGHWELMGVIVDRPFPTYPDGFPREVIELIRAAGGGDVLCNRPYNGIAAIEYYGAEHLRSGALIVYTSQDSVLQIAGHEQVVSAQTLHEICRDVRRKLPAEHQVGRVIARSFCGEPGRFQRTCDRKDYAGSLRASRASMCCRRPGCRCIPLASPGSCSSGAGLMSSTRERRTRSLWSGRGSCSRAWIAVWSSPTDRYRSGLRTPSRHAGVRQGARRDRRACREMARAAAPRRSAGAYGRPRRRSDG